MFGARVWWVEGEKVGVAWDLSCAVPKPAKIKWIKLVTIKALETSVPEENSDQRKAWFQNIDRL